MCRKTSPAISSACRSIIEPLERRQLLSAPFAALHHGLLTVHGTARADHITVSVDANNPAKLDVEVNGRIARFSEAKVKDVQVNGGKGNDDIEIDDSNGSVTTPATLAGGAGNDTLVAGAGDDELDGGKGSDSLVGGSGDDDLNGDAGDDTLVGGTGSDTMNGGQGDDSLEGGGGNDEMNGDQGDDTLQAGSGHDQMHGGDGHNTFETNDPSEVEDQHSGDKVESENPQSSGQQNTRPGESDMASVFSTQKLRDRFSA